MQTIPLVANSESVSVFRQLVICIMDRSLDRICIRCIRSHKVVVDV